MSLKRPTNNFDQSRIIGQGSYGTVYKGVLTDNKMIAIKKSKLGDQSQSNNSSMRPTLSVTIMGNASKIAIETAGAIAYLHSSTSISIIHRDIKTATILLDDNYIAKVSDFGASRLVPIDKTQLTTLVQGTLERVYSFGVVLAELLTGQKALSFDRSENERNLALYFISSMEEDDLLRILDHNLITSVEDNMEK
ncbi:hypothetical protein F8388_025976 [Cannabis sativa]|uniref:Protein kinase domain-containing protein n=1 Tax=Cannabis sativa TaxID=3483 RepID=A0A7J6EC01_CANSA|nr:hypothetical protein F8388_025976 [Cannabis sativa]